MLSALLKTSLNILQLLFLLEFLSGFQYLNSKNQNRSASLIDALAIYRKALLDFDIDPLDTLYFKTKKV